MQIIMMWRLLDDNNIPCDINDIVTIQVKIPKKLDMDEPSNAIIKEIGGNYISLIFEDPLYGHDIISIRKDEIKMLLLYKKNNTIS